MIDYLQALQCAPSLNGAGVCQQGYPIDRPRPAQPKHVLEVDYGERDSGCTLSDRG